MEMSSASRQNSSLARIGLPLVVALALVSCDTLGTSGGKSKGSAYTEDKLVPGDLISIKIQGVSDPPSYEGPIDEDGNIEMLYLGKFKAIGFTSKELAERIKYLFVERGIYPVPA